MISKSMVFLLLVSCQYPSLKEDVAKTLDEFHLAASRSDFDVYFDKFSENAVFLGTDASERWTKEEFKKYVKPHFDKKKGWTYIAVKRQIYFSKDGNTAWFEEDLKNSSLGPCRGSGVLEKSKNSWKIAHYNLLIPIPNDLVVGFARKIESFSKKKSR